MPLKEQQTLLSAVIGIPVRLIIVISGSINSIFFVVVSVSILISNYGINLEKKFYICGKIAQ